LFSDAGVGRVSNWFARAPIVQTKFAAAGPLTSELELEDVTVFGEMNVVGRRLRTCDGGFLLMADLGQELAQ